jgi:allantoinase
MLDAGVVGFKCFLVPSGVDEFPHVTEEHLREAMPELARLGALLIVHAELPGPIEMAGIPGGPLSPDRTVTNVGSTAYKTFLASRPREAENQAIEMMIRLSREFDTRVHIVHLSSAEALPMLRAAIASGVRITAETCPHYLYFAAEEIHDGATEFKCCPPIREHENREELWEALAHGTLDIVVSDHSPCPSDMKLSESGDFLAAWGGISSLQLRLPVVWTEAYRRGFSFLDISRWLCNAPARLVELEKRKGVIAAGCDADIVIWDPTQEFKVEPDVLQHRHKLTPYQGETLRGVVQKTFLRGKKVYDNGEYLRLSQGLFLPRMSGRLVR